MSPAVLRIIDANLNRAREGLRVWEDYARFGLDHQPLCAELKQLRHDLTQATREVSDKAMLHRNTPGDVGTENTTESESSRSNLYDIITAASKRLQEALRTVEEYLKTIDVDAAGKVEWIRYQTYDIELRLMRTLRPGLFAGVGLYVLITESLCHRPWLETAELALQGGATCIQLREKNLDGAELLNRCRALSKLCQKHEAICILNDRPDIAVLAGADGVHVGQTDLPCSEVRKIVGDHFIIGVSTHNINQARAAEMDGADYIGVGPVFRSSTKPRDILPGIDYARAAAAAVSIPSVAIAGITLDNAAEVLATGVQSLAVSSAVIAQENPQTAAAMLVKLIKHAVGQTFLSASGFQPEPKKPNPSSVAQTFLPVSPVQPQPQQKSTHDAVGQTFLSASGFQPEPKLKRTRRRLPHWQMDGSTYFITARLKSGKLSLAERDAIFDHIVKGDDHFYSLSGVVVMPDHFHAVLKPRKGITLSDVMKGIKGVTGRMVNQMRKTRGSIWQDESYDRLIRGPEEYFEKLEYLYFNPVRANLVEDPEDYATTYVSQK